MTPLLRAENLGKSYRQVAVFESVSFQIHSGQHLALLGPSGCGKSTALRLLAGLETPTQGEVWLEGKLLSWPEGIVVPPHQRKMAMVFQDLALWPMLTALDNVVLGLAGLASTRAARRAQAMDALKTCRMNGFAGRKPATLSIGQQQRVALARALAVRPKLLLLDEPFSGLDIALKEELFDELRELSARFEVTLLLVTHDPAEAMALCSHALVLEQQRCCEQGPLTHLLAEARSRTLQAFARHRPAIARTPELEGIQSLESSTPR